MRIVRINKAFTLIEIVMVIAIMAVLTVIVYSSFDTSRAQSRDQKRISDISTIQLALEQYFQKYGVYPVSLNDLVTGNPNVSDPNKPKFLPEIPQDSNKYNIYINQYFPLTKSAGTDKCISYQLWTKFELNNAYLPSKKGFDSTGLPTLQQLDPKKIYECAGGHTRIDASASSSSMIYDVMP